MGQPVSKEARVDKARSDAIDRQITEDSKRYKKEAKILLLGSGESGKSTIVKQMKIIHQQGFSAQERVEYRTIIYRNVLDSARTLARVVRRVGVGALGEGARAHARVLLGSFPPPVLGLGAEDGEEEGDNRASLVVEVGVDPTPFARAAALGRPSGEVVRGDAVLRELVGRERGIQTGRVSARPGTADHETPAADVLAQTHAVLTSKLADAIWHVARDAVVERLVDEHPAEFYLMDSAL
jgi:energy-coupling factor transporter ATP-binding protein EcfA2